MGGGIGATVTLPPGLLPLASLVSESASRVLLAVPSASAEELATLAAEAGVPATRPVSYTHLTLPTNSRV